MTRVIGGLVAFVLSALTASAQTQTFAVQGPDGSVGVATGVVGGIVVAPGQGPVRDNTQPQKTGTSRIRGRVVAADSGQPLRRVTIRLSSPDLREGRSTATDSEGHYEFKDLPASRYSLAATRNGYVMMSYGARRPNEVGRPLDLADKQIADRVDFSLSRGGVITGRVLDEFGEPVIGATVQPMRFAVVNGQRRESYGGSQMTTPDTGEFRLWGLTPGEYLVMVNTQRMSIGPMESTDERTGYPATYYPGTANAAEAQTVEIALGQIATGIDILLSPTRTATISGTTIDSKGQPLRRGSVMLMPRTTGSFMGMSGGGPLRPDGTFTISNVAPGEYTIRVNSPPSGPGTAPETLTASVTVSGEDITGLVLTPVRAVKVTGHITLDPPGTWVEPAGIRVQLMPKNPEPMGMMGMGPPISKDDFTFEVSSTPGGAYVRAFPAFPTSGPTSPWTVKAVRYDGLDVIDTGLELADGHDVEGVEIVLTNRHQTVSGVVTNAKAEIAADATVMFFSQDPDHWGGTAPSRYNATARPDQNGRYSVRALPPGNYFAVAVSAVDTARRGSDPRAFFENLSRQAARVTLGDGETKTVDLKLVVGQ